MNSHQDTGTTAGDSEKVLASCRYHWETAGLSPRAIVELLDELRTHLDEAGKKGRTPEDVIGPDVRSFAREWAKAHTAAGPRIARLAAGIVVVLAVLALLRHLLLRDASLAITPGYVIFVAGISAVLLGWPGRRGEPTITQFGVAAAAGLVPAVLIDWLIFPDTVLFHLPLWATATVAVAGIAFSYWENGRRR